MSMWTMQAQAMEGKILNAYWMTLLMGFGDILNGCDLIQMISNISLSWHGWWSSFDDSPQSLLINGRYLIDGCYLPRLILSGLVNIWYLPGMEVTPAFRSPRPSLTSHLTSRWNHLGHLLYVLHSKCWWSSFITEFESGALPIETPSLFVAKEQTLRPQGSSQVPTSLHFPSHLHLWVILTILGINDNSMVSKHFCHSCFVQPLPPVPAESQLRLKRSSNHSKNL